jgi:hypothetical protein
VVALPSPVKYFIEFTDLHIVDAAGQVVKDLPDINDKNGELSIGSGCDMVYGLINIRLKLAIDKLANNIEDAIVILQSKNNQLPN